MPYAPPSRCTITGCNQYAVKDGRCPDHRRTWENPSANSRALTGAQRNRFRREVLRREPNCRACGQPATEADHIIPISQGGAPTDTANGQALCTECHAAKTNIERTTRTRAGRRS